MRHPLGISMLTAAFALVACAKSGTEQPGDEGQTPPGSSTPSPSAGSSSASLENTRWRLLELNGKPATVVQSQREPHLVFQADSGRVGGATGCNLLSGPVTRNGDALTFGPLITTKMACLEQNLMDQERDFVTALGNTASHEVRGDTLILENREGQPVARLVRAPR